MNGLLEVLSIDDRSNFSRTVCGPIRCHYLNRRFASIRSKCWVIDEMDIITIKFSWTTNGTCCLCCCFDCCWPGVEFDCRRSHENHRRGNLLHHLLAPLETIPHRGRAKACHRLALVWQIDGFRLPKIRQTLALEFEILHTSAGWEPCFRRWIFQWGPFWTIAKKKTEEFKSQWQINIRWRIKMFQRKEMTTVAVSFDLFTRIRRNAFLSLWLKRSLFNLSFHTNSNLEETPSPAPTVDVQD